MVIISDVGPIFCLLVDGLEMDMYFCDIVCFVLQIKLYFMFVYLKPNLVLGEQENQV